MARVIIKKGNIFFAKIDDEYKKYFQYVALDETQLASDVIRVYKKLYKVDENPDLTDVIDDEVDFYVHCIIRIGIHFGYWEKAGNLKELAHVDVIFRDTYDFGRSEGETPIEVSKRWVVWKINDPEVTRVSELVGENRKAEIGMVMSPRSIVHRMKTGEYDLVNYPRFE